MTLASQILPTHKLTCGINNLLSKLQSLLQLEVDKWKNKLREQLPMWHLLGNSCGALLETSFICDATCKLHKWTFKRVVDRRSTTQNSMLLGPKYKTQNPILLSLKYISKLLYTIIYKIKKKKKSFQTWVFPSMRLHLLLSS